MQTFMFYLLAVVAVFSAIMVITRRQPVYSVLYLVLTFFCVAAFYVMLGAQFLAAIQIIVYAGAIMVLFLFVVMMLNLREPETMEGGSVWAAFGAIVGVGLGLVLLAYLFGGGGRLPAIADYTQSYALGRPVSMGRSLFTEFVLPFEIAGVLLLAAVIGAVALAKRERG